MRRIYMDSNATTPVLPRVIDAMQQHWSASFGNASAVHSFGRDARTAIDNAREQVADLLGARPSEITFTSGGTESDNLALFGTLRAGDHLVVSAVEHDAILHTAEALTRQGVTVSRVGCDRDGVVSPEAVREAMTPRTRLVSVMLANNETGVMQPVEAISRLVHESGAWMHTDAVQACGKLPVDVRALGCDLLSLSGHKMHGPLGVGALWVRGGLPLRPLMHGGSHERRRRAGTENVPGIVGLGEACTVAREWIADSGPEALRGLRDRLESNLLRSLSGATVHGAAVHRLPNTCSVRFEGVNAEELVIALDMKGLAISGGSACQSGAIEPSHVLQAMGLTDAEARGSVRLSLSRLTGVDEVDEAVGLLIAAVQRLRSV